MREWPTLEDLEEARRCYPEVMFPDAVLSAAAPDPAAEHGVVQASTIWKMEPETQRG